MKEQVCGNHNMLSFKHLPPIVVIEMVYTAVFWRNMFALKDGVSKTQSPSEIILSCKLNFNARCRVESGEYLQTQDEHDNTM